MLHQKHFKIQQLCSIAVHGGIKAWRMSLLGGHPLYAATRCHLFDPAVAGDASRSARVLERSMEQLGNPPSW